MKNLIITRALLPLLLTGPLAAGQTNTSPQTQDRQSQNNSTSTRILAARGQYILEDARQEDNSSQAQFPRRRPGPGFSQDQGYPGPYPGLWTPEGNGRATAIGVLVGFGLGAAAGATANTDGRGKVGAALFVGSLGALFGAVVGHSISVFHLHRPYYGSPWPDPDEDAQVLHKHSAQARASAKPARPDVSATADTQSQPTAEAP